MCTLDQLLQGMMMAMPPVRRLALLCPTRNGSLRSQSPHVGMDPLPLCMTLQEGGKRRGLHHPWDDPLGLGMHGDCRRSDWEIPQRARTCDPKHSIVLGVMCLFLPSAHTHTHVYIHTHSLLLKSLLFFSWLINFLSVHSSAVVEGLFVSASVGIPRTRSSNLHTRWGRWIVPLD